MSDTLNPPTDELERLLKISAKINEKSPEGFKEKFAYSFSSILLAFFIAKDPISVWFQNYAKNNKIDIKNILDFKKINYNSWEKIIESDINRQSNDMENWTDSARGVWSIAQNYVNQLYKIQLSIQKQETQQTMLLDVRHIMAAYIYGKHGHEQQLLEWGFNMEEMSNEFVNKLSQLQIASFELDYWSKIHSKKFKKPVTILQTYNDLAKGNKLSKHLETDKWTDEDQLNYLIYAHSLFRFITHSQTSNPLSISIQAPWGGGKTSLMKMLQKNLDPRKVNIEIKTKDSDKQKEISLSKDDEAKVKDILYEIINPIRILIKKEEKNDAKDSKMTIWFNAWKYESTHQVWAGLVDSIIQQVTNKMKRKQKEIFFFKLNLKRIDTNKIRQKVYDTILIEWWKNLRPWLIGTVSATAVFIMASISGWMLNNQSLLQSGGYGAIISTIFGASQSVQKYFKTNKDIEESAANVSFSEYVTIPDYESNLGFIHHVVGDLETVFKCIDEDLFPLVIFIDDLDRCSPNNIGKVMEGINLFLAGEFENCIIVMGMDSDLVAAALEVEHNNVISKLQSYTNKNQIGWKFMDKFVQLPLIIPPPTHIALEKYVKHLLSKDKLDHQKTIPIKNTYQNIDDLSTQKEKPQNMEFEGKNDKEEIIRLTDSTINKLSDQDEEFQDQIIKAVSEFSSNPRDIKRFMNVLRFQRFIWATMGTLLSETGQYNERFPSLDQLGRWITLTLKWPSAVRWIYSDDFMVKSDNQLQNNNKKSKNDKNLDPQINRRLQILEDISTELYEMTYEEKQKKIREHLLMDPNSVIWIMDENLWNFFRREKGFNNKERLSFSIGQGIY